MIKGLYASRLEREPDEKKFVKEWERTHECSDLFKDLLSEQGNFPLGPPEERDRVIAATLIQWLGSTVGQCFLNDCGFSKTLEPMDYKFVEGIRQQGCVGERNCTECGHVNTGTCLCAGVFTCSKCQFVH